MRHLIFTLFLCAAFLIISCRQQPEVKQDLPGESYQSFTTDGAWCWFSDPRAIHYRGDYNRTYAGWVTSDGSIEVGSYDHDTGEIQTHTIHARLEVDDHNNPAFDIDSTGRLLVFYSMHSHKVPTFLARSTNPEDITTWEPARQLALNDSVTYQGLSNTYTYASICRLSEEHDRMFLFWRGADFKPNFSVSSDNGVSWSPGRIFILPERLYRDRRPYFKISSDGKRTIHFAFTDGHPNREPTNSIYYAAYRDGAMYRANGEKIVDMSALPLEPRQADVVYDATTTEEKAWIWDVAEDKHGNPVIVYARFPSDSMHIYYYSSWHEGKWTNHELVNSGGWFPHTPEGAVERETNYSGGIVLVHTDPSVVYLSREINGVFEIEKWTTPDHGKTWTTHAVTANSAHDNVRPFVIRNYNEHDSLRVLWLNVERYTHYTDYKAAVKMNVVP